MFKLYDAIVVSDETDRTLSGAVRVSILGVTDSIEDDYQPWALPAVNYLMGVPTKGSYLKVYLEDDDIHQPIYIHVSPQKSYLPDDYINNYPNVAIANLGSDFFQMLHDRVQRRTVVDHDSDSRLTWDSFGKITHESDRGYDNTGFGAKQGNGKKTQRVLTEGTINILTCSPHSGGSEYLEITHVSNDTVNGTLESQERLNEQTYITDENGLDTPISRPLLDGEIEYVQAKNIITSPNRTVKYILIGSTGNSNFADSVSYILESNLSSHYVIGRNIDEFIQMIDLDKIGTLGSKGTFENENSLNKKSITVLLCGIPTQPYSTSQYENINKVIEHARNLYGNQLQIVTIDQVDSISGGLFGALFDRTKLI